MSIKNPTFFAGLYRALSYAYGVASDVPGLILDLPAAVTNAGTQTLTVAFGQISLPDGTVISPLAIGTKVTVGTGNGADTVTISAVSNGTPQVYQSSNFTAATFANAHGTGDKVSTATVGLQEALNAAAGVGGGIVVVDAAWYLNGGTAAMITAASVHDTVAIWDTSTGGPFIAASLLPTTTTPLAAPSALTTAVAANGMITTATTGGTIPASATYRLAVTYVDAFGGETTISTDTASTATIATGSGTSTNTITVTSPAALTGAVGYRVYMTAASGASLSEILYPQGNAAITGTVATANVGALPSFQIGTPVVINAIITGTAKIPAQATAQVVAPAELPNAPYISYLPFTALGTIAAAATGTLAQVNFPAGFWNALGRTVRFKGMYYVTTNGTGGTVTTELILSSIFGVTTIIPFTAASAALAASTLTVNFEYDITMVTAATGTTGTLECHGTVAYNAAGTAVGSLAMDSIQAVSSTLDLTKQNTLTVAHLNTTLGTSISQNRILTVEVLQ